MELSSVDDWDFKAARHTFANAKEKELDLYTNRIKSMLLTLIGIPSFMLLPMAGVFS